jgi:DNA-binding NtrC family response regulator
MNAQPTLYWISSTASPDPQETRIQEILKNSTIRVVTAGLHDLDSMQEAVAGDLLVLNTDANLASISLAAIRRTVPAARLLLRCGIEEIPPGLAGRLAEQFIVTGILDPEEGPELTRSRIISAFGVPRRIRDDAASVPEWRRWLIGQSRPMQKVAEFIRLVGPRRSTVLITGETGTGKEVVARSIHRAGPRASGPFVPLNCGAVPLALLEAELFGHTRGAFTGALQLRVGRFEEASGGTLFLDEIGDIPLELQVKLLRVLQEREVQKIGSSESVRVDARIIAATNCDLPLRVQNGSFREDLFYRLNVVPLELPPLRMRISDVRPLAEHFLEKVSAEEQIAPKKLTPQAWAALENYDWPGNVRQLENAISSAVILSESRTYLDADDFHLRSISRILACAEIGGPMELPDHGLDFEKTVSTIERDLLTQALRRTRGNKKAAAEMLRLKRTTLSAKVRVLDIQAGQT